MTMTNKECKKIGIAGYMGAGKSTITSLFAKNGVKVFNADIIAKDVIQNSDQIKKSLLDMFGSTIFKDGNISFDELGKIVFDNEYELARLNSTVYPLLIENLEKRLNTYTFDNTLLVLDAALISLWGIEEWFDILIWVHAPVEQRLARLMKSRGWSEEETKKRMNLQHKLFKEPDGGIWNIIKNDGDLSDLKNIVDDIL